MPLPKGIYFEYKPADIHEVHKRFHAYLVFRDNDGGEWVIRGGLPDDPETLPFGGNITAQADTPLQLSKDQYGENETPESRHAKRLDLGGRDPDQVWREMTAKAKEIGEAGIDYNLVNDVEFGASGIDFTSQTSNSVIRAALEAGKIDPIKALPPGLTVDDITGYENNLANPQGGFDSERKDSDPGRKPIEVKPPAAPGTKGTGPRSEAPALGDRPVPSAAALEAAEDAEAGAGVEPDPRAARAMLDRIKNGREAVDEILNKPVQAVTRDEIDRVIASDKAMSRGHGDFQRANDFVTAWFGRVFGGLEGGQEDIAEGRIAPVAIAAPAPDGGTVTDGAMNIGREVLRDAAGIGMRPAVAKLQEALNSSVDSGKPLVRDGAFGPRTNRRLRQAVARQGTGRVLDGFRRAFPPERI